MMCEVTSGETPHYIHSLFTRSTSRYALNKIIPPRPRIDLYKTSLAFSWSSTWNFFPSSLKNLRSIKCFKRRLYKHLGGLSTAVTYTATNSTKRLMSEANTQSLRLCTPRVAVQPFNTMHLPPLSVCTCFKNVHGLLNSNNNKNCVRLH